MGLLSKLLSWLPKIVDEKENLNFWIGYHGNQIDHYLRILENSNCWTGEAREISRIYRISIGDYLLNHLPRLRIFIEEYGNQTELGKFNEKYKALREKYLEVFR